MKKLFSRLLWSILTAVFVILLIAILIGSHYAQYYAAQINSYFNCKTYELIEDEFAAVGDTQYYKPKFTDANGEADKAALYEYDKQVARKAAGEGAVLLWNTNNALPFSDKSKPINFYGGRSVNWYYVTEGSGGTRMSEAPTVKAAFEDAGYTVNGALWNLYGSHSASGGTWGSNETGWIDGFASATDGGYGVYVLARKGSEGSDMATAGSDGQNGNLTALSQNEIDHIEGLISLKNSGKLDKVIVLLNSASASIQFDKLMTYKDDIDACLWVGLGGTSGPAAVADLMTGAVTPSGRLSDTFVYNSFSAPSTANLGDFDYGNANGFTGNEIYKKLKSAQGTGDSTEKNLKYIVYAEGIYVGYRYYETRYEDCVIGQGNADGSKGIAGGRGTSWNYADEVAYPFGYGLSYTTFSYGDFGVKHSGDTYTVSLTVTNTGNTYSGKEVVQVYLQKPYTEYDKTNKIEQSAVNLVGFGKTELLAPGDSQTLSIAVKESEFLTYDANNAKTYITEGGDYYLAVGTDAHDALNNILKAKGYTGDREGDDSLVYKTKLSADYSPAKSVYTGEEITNRCDDIDINKTSYGAGSVTYLSRSDWQGTYPQKVELNLTESLLKDLDYGKSWVDDEFEIMPEYGAVNGYTLFSFWKDTDGNEVPYDHELWDALLDQTTFTEQTYLIANAWCATQAVESVAAPTTANRDGPAGLNYLPDSKIIGLGMCYPSENLLASSFNVDIVREIGECLGEDNLACGFTFLYAPGANTHRSAFGGRNGEYYSEDGFLAGMMSEYEVKGLQSNGSGAQIKHYALNDQEINRNGGSMWANEQSIREIYLKAFEGGCAKGRGESLSVMNSFTRFGAIWAGAHSGMMKDILRTEWGFEGFVQSDGNGYALMSNYVDGLRGGTDLFMCGGGKRCLDAYADSTTIALAMREATHHILYALSRTHAMNGLTATTRIVTLTPWWEYALTGLKIGFGVLAGASAVMLVVSFVLASKGKKN